MSTLNQNMNPTISSIPIFLTKDLGNYLRCYYDHMFSSLTVTQYLLFKEVTTYLTPISIIYLRGKGSFFLAYLIQGQLQNFGEALLTFPCIYKYKIK